MAEKHEIARRDREPFALLGKFADEMDQLFDEFGLGRTWFGPRLRLPRPVLRRTEGWLPDVEIAQRDKQLVIKADLPGIAKDDVKVEVTDDAVTIEGERKHEHEEESGGVYRSERSYGSFRRVIPVPQGTATDQARASFKDGVLEITMPAPPEASAHARRLEIGEGAAKK